MILLSALASKGATSFTFTLDEPCKTSAGVFQTDGTLVRTLWSNIRYLQAGNYSTNWDGNDDSGSSVSAGTYVIKVMQHNVEYVWDGTIGNTSAAMIGSSVHLGFFFIQDMVFTTTEGFYCSGYNEAHFNFRRFSISDSQRVTTNFNWHIDQFGTTANSIGISSRNFNWAATDGTRVYFACDSSYRSYDGSSYASNGFFIAVSSASDINLSTFSSGTVITNAPGDSFPSGVRVGTQPGLSGLAVQSSSNLVAVSVGSDNKIYFFNKTTGAAASTPSLTVANPGRLSFGTNGDLWAVSGSNIVCVTNVNGSPNTRITNSSFATALAVSVCPTNANIIVVADGGTNQQVRAFDTNGASLWTYGLAGGYQTNGPAVANNKFWFILDSDTITTPSTFISFVPDGSFWVGDGGNHRAMHFAADRTYIDQIMYQGHTYASCVDYSNPTRVFNQWLEYSVDYTKPLSNAWVLVNNWKANTDPRYYGFPYGMNNVVDMSNGRTYALAGNSNIVNAPYELAELVPATGWRPTGIFPMTNAVSRWVSLETDSSTRAVGIGHATFFKSTLNSFDGSNNPIWNAAASMGTGPEGVTDPVARCCVGYNLRATTSTNNVIIGFDSTLNSGFHLGGIRVGGSSWLWKASPSGLLNNDGHFEVTTVTYPASCSQALDNHVVFAYNGEFFRGQGQASQHFHFLDDGLFVGQFGETAIGHTDVATAIPGNAGGNQSPVFVSPTTGGYYLWDNDESAHGPQRWHFANAGNIRELQNSVAKDGSVGLTNQTCDFATGVVAKSGNQSAQLSWFPVASATGYKVYSSTNNGGPYQNLQGSTAATIFTANGLVNGTTYYFVVAATIGTDRTPSKQVKVLPFDTTKRAIAVGRLDDGAAQNLTWFINSGNVSAGVSSLTGNTRLVGTKTLADIANQGTGNLMSDNVGSKGYVIYGFNGPNTGITNIPSGFVVTNDSGWTFEQFINQQFSVDGLIETNTPSVKTLRANPTGIISVKPSDANYHILTVYSPFRFNDARQFTMTLTSTNGDAAAYSVNEAAGSAHTFQWLFKGDSILTAAASGAGLGIVQALFLDDVQTASASTMITGPVTITGNVTIQ